MQNRYLIGMVASLALGATLVACGGSDASKTTSTQSTPAAQAATSAPTTAAPASAATEPSTLSVKAADFSYDPKDATARPGKITITLTNTSTERPHTIAVKKKDGSDFARSGRIESGQSGALELTIDEEGTYEMYCTLPGHADRGQKGTLTIKKA